MRLRKIGRYCGCRHEQAQGACGDFSLAVGISCQLALSLAAEFGSQLHI
jgi:hypothetical protein